MIKESTLKGSPIPAYEALRFKSAQDARRHQGLVAFLSHSHEDGDLAKKLQREFEKRGIALYIDSQDRSLESNPVEQVAREIRNKILDADILIYLATKNAANSRWCPWEIGVADAGSEFNRVFIFTLLDEERRKLGAEYLDIYPEITTDNADQLLVFDKKKNMREDLTGETFPNLKTWAR